MMINNYKYVALMTFCRFMILVPKGIRAKMNLPYIQELTRGNAIESSHNEVSISLDASSLLLVEDTIRENNFTATALLLDLNSSMSFTNKNKKKSKVELFEANIKTVCESLKELASKISGFYWSYYNYPYFITMSERSLVM